MLAIFEKFQKLDKNKKSGFFGSVKNRSHQIYKKYTSFKRKVEAELIFLKNCMTKMFSFPYIS